MTGACGHDASQVRVRRNGVRDCLICQRARARRRRDTERDAGRRRPLVLSATRTAIDAAAELLPGRVIENLVGDAIAAGAIKTRTRIGSLVVNLGGGIEAVCAPAKSDATGRSAWRPTAVHPARKENP